MAYCVFYKWMLTWKQECASGNSRFLSAMKCNPKRQWTLHKTLFEMLSTRFTFLYICFHGKSRYIICVEAEKLMNDSGYLDFRCVPTFSKFLILLSSATLNITWLITFSFKYLGTYDTYNQLRILSVFLFYVIYFLIIGSLFYLERTYPSGK